VVFVHIYAPLVIVLILRMFPQTVKPNVTNAGIAACIRSLLFMLPGTIPVKTDMSGTGSVFSTNINMYLKTSTVVWHVQAAADVFGAAR